VHVIASDAHDDKYRKPILSEARDAVSRSFGADFTHALVLENPAAIIAGLSLPSSRETSRDTSQKFLGKIG
jgi:tyrosine-protein phosphatase YwqE